MMNIEEFISKFSNHPILFVGTGMSLRYLNNSFTWDGLLQKISFELKNNDEFYLDIKSKHGSANKYNYDEIAKELEMNSIVVWKKIEMANLKKLMISSIKICKQALM